MRYVGQTFSYLKKNFWLPTVAMLIPSVLACFLSTPYWEVSFVAAFDYEPYISAAQTFEILFGDSWQYVWPVIVIAVTQTFAAALIMSTIDRHFRTGKLSLSSPWRMINNSIFPIAIGIVVMSVLSIVWRVLLFGLVMLVQVSASAMGLPAYAALAAISVVSIALFILHVIIITPMLFWAPIMFIYGYRFRDAAAASFKLISGKKIFRSMFLPILICAVVQLLMGYLQVHYAIAVAVNFAVFLFTNGYITVFTMLTFYDIKPYQATPLPTVYKKSEQPQASPEQNVASDSAADVRDGGKTDKQDKKLDKTEPKKPRRNPAPKSDGKKTAAKKPVNKSEQSKIKGKTVSEKRKPDTTADGEEGNNGI